MFEYNIIVYAEREGYELKTWLDLKEDATEDEINIAARDKFTSLGVQLKENEVFDYDWY